MFYTARLVGYVLAGTVFVLVRRVLVALLRTLPQDHPFRVAQESVYRHLTDDLIRRTWRPVKPNGGGKTARNPRPCMRPRLSLVAVFALKAMPLALMVPAMLLTN